MPEQLLGRIIRSCSEPGDVVLDPFSGSATTVAVAKKLGRKYVAFDLSQDYVALGLERLAGIKNGDSLNGAPEPTMSAPKTPGKTRSKRMEGRELPLG
jgi:site-specific DNA-methyltransferase (adenine-specific)